VSKLTARGTIILVLVALGVLLIAPGVAQAHVRAKYKVKYAHDLGLAARQGLPLAHLLCPVVRVRRLREDRRRPA